MGLTSLRKYKERKNNVTMAENVNPKIAEAKKEEQVKEVPKKETKPKKSRTKKKVEPKVEEVKKENSAE